MNMSGESLLIILVVGLVAGWLAGQIVQGTGLGIIGDIVVGILGAFIGSWVLPQLGIHLGSGIVSAIINATIGAVVLLLVIRLVRGGSGWRAGDGRDADSQRLATAVWARTYGPLLCASQPKQHHGGVIAAEMNGAARIPTVGNASIENPPR